jgi:hypothetical protein
MVGKRLEHPDLFPDVAYMAFGYIVVVPWVSTVDPANFIRLHIVL